jgi:hypothetical protein
VLLAVVSQIFPPRDYLQICDRKDFASALKTDDDRSEPLQGYMWHISKCFTSSWGHAVAQLVEALRYKPEGRGFDYPWCHCNFLLT